MSSKFFGTKYQKACKWVMSQMKNAHLYQSVGLWLSGKLERDFYLDKFKNGTKNSFCDFCILFNALKKWLEIFY